MAGALEHPAENGGRLGFLNPAVGNQARSSFIELIRTVSTRRLVDIHPAGARQPHGILSSDQGKQEGGSRRCIFRG